MKKFIAGLILVMAIGAYAITETHTTGTRSTLYTHHKNTASNYGTLKKVAITQTGAPPADFTETLDTIHGVILRISISILHFLELSS